MTNFNEMGLDQSILKGIESLGFVNATEIQSQAIPKILSSKNDLIALAQTGTGKTAAFSLPILQQIDLSDRSVQTLVLCPTRELCIQIAKDMVSYCKFVSGLRVTAVYGGAAIVNQIKELRSGSQIVVGTPGRVNDLIRRKVLKIESIKYLVLDEADEMLNMGFKEELDEILVTTPEEKQTLLFSATMPKEIAKIAEKYMHDPDRIEVGTRNSGSDQIAHEYYMVHAKDRYQVLKRLADINPNIYGIVFCRTRQETKDIADKLIHDGYNADALHGDLSQAQRDHVMNR
ncbi:MAG: DEAD/DEAH box helicase, partial [Calditrichaeota bacterium]|nr:DEAD/DEAH box helicase [Calditrichota bacterium]